MTHQLIGKKKVILYLFIFLFLSTIINTKITSYKKQLGKLKIYYKDDLLEEHDLLAYEDIKKLNIFSRILSSINYLIWGDV